MNGSIALECSATSRAAASAANTVSVEAGEVVKQAAVAIAIPAITSGTAPITAATSGAITIVLPAPIPAMYVANA